MASSTKSVLIVTYGRTNFLLDDPESSLTTFVLNDTLEFAKEVIAAAFIRVIPDDPDPYLSDVEDWDGSSPHVVYHEDDDHFYLSITVVKGKVDEGSRMATLSKFNAFCDEFDASPDPDDE